MLKKISALLLVLVMVLAVSAAAFADGEATLKGGESGAFTAADTVAYENNKKIKIAKELTAYNVDETTIKAPTISYTYTITAGDADKSITDEDDDHDPEGAVNRKTFSGITSGVKLDGTADGNDDGIIAWSTADELTADAAGAPNYKYLTIDFNGVAFEKPGVYRYVLREALTSGTYAQTGVTENTVATDPVTHTHTRYLDVYVKTSSTYTDGRSPEDWNIYGYVCMIDNDEITPDDDTTTQGAVKTNGFVSATNDGTATSADSYYTFNVTVSKTLTGDAYSDSHKFPVHIDFTNAAVTNDVLLMAETTGTSTSTDYAHTAAAASNLDGLAKIANKGSIKYIGIPCGTTVTVYETNDVAGTTYEATLTVDGTAGGTKTIISTTTPNSFAQHAVQPYNSLKGEVTTTADTVDATTGRHTVAITNEFSMISPTGVTLRVAPYALILFAGLALLLISRRRKAAVED